MKFDQLNKRVFGGPAQQNGQLDEMDLFDEDLDKEEDLNAPPTFELGELRSLGGMNLAAPRVTVLQKSATTATSKDVLLVEITLPSVVEKCKLKPTSDHMAIEVHGHVNYASLEDMTDADKATIAAAIERTGHSMDQVFGALDNEYRLATKEVIMTIEVSRELVPSSQWTTARTPNGMLLVAPYVGEMSKDVELEITPAKKD